MTVPVLDVPALLAELAGLDDSLLVALAQRGRTPPEPPAFSGRCLQPEHLEAVARGDWTPDDERRLALCLARAEVLAVRRVARRHRRGLRSALRATALALLTERVTLPGWQQRREQLAGAWRDVVGPLPIRTPAAA